MRWNDLAFCRDAVAALFNSEGRLVMEIEQALSSELLNMATLALAGTLCVHLFDYDSNSRPAGNDGVIQHASSTLAELTAVNGALVEAGAEQDITLVDLLVRYLFSRISCSLIFFS